MSLEKYWRKRDFNKTPEPEGRAESSAGKLLYVIQKHAAQRLHYDFRLELGGTLKSWAVPKGPSLDPRQKRLAVQVEDHPLSYGGFEGTIPARQYGAGTVMLWDRGEWLPEGDAAEGYRQGRLNFQLKGGRLSGRWSLVRMARRDEERQENWLLIKSDDDAVRKGAAAEITEQITHSVLSQRSMEDIAQHRESKPDEAEPGLGDAKGRPSAARLMPRQQPGGASMPVELEPQLATLVDRVPQGSEWLAELKYDGYRLLARVRNKEVRLISRSGGDWTGRMPALAEAIDELGLASAWLDGEVVAVDASGSISFQSLQNAFPRRGDTGKPVRLLYFLFDLLWLGEEDLRELAQRERKARLQDLLKDLPPDSPLKYSEHIAGRMAQVFQHACLHGQEGVILKSAEAAYTGGRTSHWLKLKCALRQEFVIGGYSDPQGSRHGFGALLLGYYEKGQLVYAGRVGTGFDDDLLISLSKRLSPLTRDRSAFAVPPTDEEAAGTHWVEPVLVAEVRFAGWTDTQRLRHAAFISLREDKPAAEVVKERPMIPAEADGEQSSRKSVARRSSNKVAGVTITHPDRVLFDGTGLTKLGVAEYYAQIAAWLMPHLRDRPLSLVRCPQGPEHPCFFQKHMDGALPPGLTPVEIQQRDGPAQYMVANKLEAVIGLVQMGVLEFHTWGARRDRLDRPDRMIFDLDPAPEVSWQRVVDAAHLLRTLLEELGFTCFLKTTGGKGLHIEVPLKRGDDWARVKGFAQQIAQHMAGLFPERFTANMAKARRANRIFIDYLRNAEGATAVAAYSLRARPGAPVAVPIAWAELADGIRADHFTVKNVMARLEAQKSDPWEGYEQARVRITKAMLGRLGDGTQA